jgi:phosphoribosylformimino-5-aminoimidazole carboxamide ribotide isomerase
MSKWIEDFGQEHIILGADTRDGMISVNGWKEDSTLKLSDFIRGYMQKGITQVLCTDINRDGMLQGPATELYKALLKEFPGIKLIASGGVSSLEDLTRLKEAGLPAAIVGKAYYEGRITLEQLSQLSQE